MIKLIRRIIMFLLHKLFVYFSEMKKCENIENMTERSPQTLEIKDIICNQVKQV